MRPAVECRTAQEVFELYRDVIGRRRAREAELAANAALREPPPAPPPEPAPPPPMPVKPFLCTPRLAPIVEAVCENFRIRYVDLVGPRRIDGFAHPRQISMMLCRTLTPYGLKQIGRYHNRDHTTTLHATQKWAWMRLLLEAQLVHEDPPDAWAKLARHLYYNSEWGG